MKTPVPVLVSQAQSARTGIDTTGLPGQSSRPAVMPFAMGAGLQRGGGDAQPVASQATHGGQLSRGGGLQLGPLGQAVYRGPPFAVLGPRGGLFAQAGGGQPVTSQATRGGLGRGLQVGLHGGQGGLPFPSMPVTSHQQLGGGGLQSAVHSGVSQPAAAQTMYSIKELTCQAGTYAQN